MTHRPTAVLVSCALVLGAGCLTEPQPDEPTPPTVAAQAKKPCEDVFCGNTPKLGSFPFWELDLSRTSFSPTGGFRITSMTGPGNGALTPEVYGYVLVGRTAANALVTAPATLKLQVVADTGEQYELTFVPSGSFHYLDAGGDPPKQTYDVTYRLLNGVAGSPSPSLPLCTPTLGNYPRKSLVFRGDRYDPTTGRVTAIGAAAGTWFNIACEDDAIWKLAVMQLVQAAEVANQHSTTQDQRTAGLRAIRADFCGTGISYTELGTAVDWQNAWLTYDAATYPDLEAIWGSDGARCLDHQRIASRRVGCVRPSCATLAAAQTAGLMRTYVKAPPP